MKFVCLTIVFGLIYGALAQPVNENSADSVTPHTVTLEEADKSVDTSEQHDPMFQGIGGMNPYASMYAGMNGFGPQENAVDFDFRCKCKAKSNLPVNLQAPTDANAAAQQQITQLQDQIRRLNEQIRRTQEGRSNFEQFAQILSMADGLDCNCSGSSAPFSNFPYGGTNSMNSGNQMGMSNMGSSGFGRQLPFMGGQNMPSMMGQRIFPPGMFP